MTKKTKTKKTKTFFVRLGLDVTLNKGFTVEAKDEEEAEEKARAAADADPAPFSTWDFDAGMGVADCEVLDVEEEDKSMAVCDNCGTRSPVDDLGTVSRLHERVESGGEMPAGECPKCGSLAYEED